jgi:hypothetical protein
LRQSHADCHRYTDGHRNRYSPTHAHAEISADAEAASHARPATVIRLWL